MLQTLIMDRNDKLKYNINTTKHIQSYTTTHKTNCGTNWHVSYLDNVFSDIDTLYMRCTFIATYLDVVYQYFLMHIMHVYKTCTMYKVLFKMCHK